MVIEIKVAEENDIEKIVNFHNSNYNDNRNKDQWNWEYKKSLPDNSVFSIIVDDNKVIGTQGMIPYILKIKQESILSGKSENSLLSEDYRGGSLFYDLYSHAMKESENKGMKFIWGFTPAYKVWRYKLGFKDYSDQMYGSLLILKPINYINTFLKTKNDFTTKIMISVSSIPLFVYSSIKRYIFNFLRNSSSDYTIKTKYDDVKDINNLYAILELENPNLIYIDQNENFLNWRVINNPNLNYKSYYLYEKNILKAYCHIAITKKQSAYLSDFTFLNEDYGNELLKYSIIQMQKENINCIYYLVGNISNKLIQKIKSLLTSNGYISKKNESFIVIKNINYNKENILYDIKNWYINDLWTEGYERQF
jgi:hypothetical protein